MGPEAGLALNREAGAGRFCSRITPTRQPTRLRCRVDWNAAAGSRWGLKGLRPYLGGLLSHPVLQGTAAPTGAGPRVEGSRWGGGGTSGPWGDVRLEQNPFFGTVEGCVVRLLH